MCLPLLTNEAIVGLSSLDINCFLFLILVPKFSQLTKLWKVAMIKAVSRT